MPRQGPPPTTLFRGAAALVLLAPLASCGSDGGDPTASGAPERWTLEPQLRIGSIEGDDALSLVSDVALAPDGRVFVVLPRERRVAVFGPEGRPAASLGREGEGPGELMGPGNAGFLGDTLWIHDGRQRRTSLYTAEGEHLDDVPDPTVEGLGEEVRAGFGALVAGGRMVAPASAAFGSSLEGTDHPFPLLVLPRRGGPADTLGFRYTAHDRAMITTGSGGQLTSVEIFQNVFADGTLWNASPDGRAVALVDRAVADGADSAAYRVTRVDLTGDTAFSVEVPYEPRPVAAQRVDSIVGRYTAGERSEAEIRDVLFLPDHLPPASDVVAGDDGSVWVARESVPGEPVRWDVFDAGGARVAWLESPAELRVHVVTPDALWGTLTDELDVPYVVRYGVRRGEGPPAG